MKKLSAGFEIESVDLGGNLSRCDKACLDYYDNPVCHSYDFDNITNNCTLMKSDYISMATTLEDSADSLHREWHCHNGTDWLCCLMCVQKLEKLNMIDSKSQDYLFCQK
jgi:hypothetical protein